MKFLPYIKTGFLSILSFILVSSIIFFPKQAFEASLRGLTIWWDVVFPALLPFFITAELLMGFGVVHFLGVLLEPLMRPLFRVPGAGGFVMSMGLASGYPMGAKLTVRLREEGIITRSEGERLVSIATTSGPLFMFGAVAVGFFHDVRLGIIIAASHYLAALGVGLLMRFHDSGSVSKPSTPTFGRSLFYRALQGMHRARMNDGRTLGTLMGDAVTSSVQTLLMIGGFIIMFSVIINIMTIIGISSLLSALFSFICIALGISTELNMPMLSGLFEITLGSQLASASSSPLIHKVAIASAIISWSGLSVHAQVASMLAKTDISYKPFLFARIIHACLAGFGTIILWQPLQHFMTHFETSVFEHLTWTDIGLIWDRYVFFSYALLLLFIMFIILSFLLHWAKRRAGKYI